MSAPRRPRLVMETTPHPRGPGLFERLWRRRRGDTAARSETLDPATCECQGAGGLPPVCDGVCVQCHRPPARGQGPTQAW